MEIHYCTPICTSVTDRPIPTVPVLRNRLQWRRLGWRCIPLGAWCPWLPHPVDSKSGLHAALPGMHRAKLDTDSHRVVFNYSQRKHHHLLCSLGTIRRDVNGSSEKNFKSFIIAETDSSAGEGKIKMKEEGDDYRSKAMGPNVGSTFRKGVQAMPSQQTWVLLLSAGLPHVFVNTAGMSWWDALAKFSFTWLICALVETKKRNKTQWLNFIRTFKDI